MLSIQKNWYSRHDGDANSERMVAYLNANTTVSHTPYKGSAGYFYGVIGGEPFRRKEDTFFVSRGLTRYNSSSFVVSTASKTHYTSPLHTGGWYFVSDGSRKSADITDYINSKSSKVFKGSVGKCYGLDENKKGRCRAEDYFIKDNQIKLPVNQIWGAIPSMYQTILEVAYKPKTHTPPPETHMEEKVIERIVEVPLISTKLPTGRDVSAINLLYDVRFRNLSKSGLIFVLSEMNVSDWNILAKQANSSGFTGGSLGIYDMLHRIIWNTPDTETKQTPPQYETIKEQPREKSLSYSTEKAKAGSKALPLQKAIIIKRRKK